MGGKSGLVGWLVILNLDVIDSSPIFVSITEKMGIMRYHTIPSVNNPCELIMFLLLSLLKLSKKTVPPLISSSKIKLATLPSATMLTVFLVVYIQII